MQVGPDKAQTYNGLGTIFARQDRTHDAIRCYQEALRLKPDYAEVHNNLGTVFEQQGKLEEAFACYQQAVRVKPTYAEAINNLGFIAYGRNNLDEAMRHYDTALRLKPALGVARSNRSILLLLHGDFVNGWADYEARLTVPRLPRRTFPQPRWDGSRLDGRTILLHAEQGLGDTLQFIRYAPLVHGQGGKVVVECQPPLLRLLTGARGIDQLVATGTPLPPFDVQSPLPSLPGIFRATLETLPNEMPYLQAEAKLVAHWRQELQSLRGWRVGIAWQGNPANLRDKPRSFPLRCFAKIAAIDGVQLISLQYGPGTDQLAALNGEFPVVNLTNRLGEGEGEGEGCDSFANIAAIMANLDLVMSCDTSIAHLAGALGRNVWVPLPVVPDWRWLLGREDSPWYPTMRLFRQTSDGNWPDVFERMAAALRSLVTEGKP